MTDQNNIIHGIPFKFFDSHKEALNFAEGMLDNDYAITEVDIEDIDLT